MADKQLEYWFDWEICGSDGSVLIDLKNSSLPSLPPVVRGKIDPIENLCERITEYPDPALTNKDTWYQINMLRQKAFKDKESKESLEKVLKAILGDGRRRRNQESLDRLKSLILRDINFFRKILEFLQTGKKTVDEAIIQYLTEDVPDDDQELYDKRENEKSNYENIYCAYKRIHSMLKDKIKMTDEEIFCFFETAANNLMHTNIQIDVEPNERLLTFVKMKTWFVKGYDMVIGS
jgi:hypothetical protein